MKLNSVNKMISCLSCEKRIYDFELARGEFVTKQLFYHVLDETVSYPVEFLWYHTWKGLHNEIGFC